MESEIIIPLVAALIGTVIGSLSSIITIWLQQSAQSKREKIRLASEMAMEDHKFTYDLAMKTGKGGRLAPVTSFQNFHYEVLIALEKGNLTDEKLVEIVAKNSKLMDALKEFRANT